MFLSIDVLDMVSVDTFHRFWKHPGDLAFYKSWKIAKSADAKTCVH